MTAGLTVRAEDVASSTVFEDVSLSESWTANSAVVSVSLARDAVVEQSIAELSVVDAAGKSVWTGSVEPGQTRVSQVHLPVNTGATIYAVDASGAIVDDVDVSVRGSRLP
jgi:hypothetical protein